MIRECIVIAGGLGTRLSPVWNATPKVLAPVNGFPFLYYLLKYLKEQKITRLVFALGFKSEIVEEWLRSNPVGLDIILSIEDNPLGTGGAIRKALDYCQTEDIFYINGDTFFNVDFSLLESRYHQMLKKVCIAIKPMKNPFRYGTVELVDSVNVRSFKEKAEIGYGFVNGGVGVFSKSFLIEFTKMEVFSFEKDFLEVIAPLGFLGAVEFNEYFIDIGVPEDYQKAQGDFKRLL